MAYDMTSASYAYVNFDVSTETSGSCGNNNAAVWGTPSCTVTGTGGGWRKLSLTVQCIAAAGCAIRPRFCSDNSDGTCSSIAGSTGDAWYAWGGQLHDGQRRDAPYCPSDSSTQTCNAATNNSVALTWDMAEGVISSVAHQTSEPGAVRAYHLKPSTDLGIVLNAYQTNAGELFIYNNASVLQQRIGDVAYRATNPLGTIMIYDSGGAFYGTRRAALRSYSSDYAGLRASYTTDTGANWTPGTNPSLYLGLNDVSTGQLDGYMGNVCIWKDR